MRSRLARLIGVDLTISQNHYFRRLQEVMSPDARWVDIGCGHQIVPDWAGAEESQRELVEKAGLFLGADLDPSIRQHNLLQHGVFASVTELPFADRSFDLVTANMVVEHLEDPLDSFKEIRRTLRPGGLFLFHTPNYGYYAIFIASFIPDSLKNKVIWLLERRKEEDIFHTYYRANTVEDVQSILRQAGFEDVHCISTRSTGLFQFLGPIGVLEILWLKLLDWSNLDTGRSTLIVTARRPSDPTRA